MAGDSFAVSVRLEAAGAGRTAFNRRHALREGKIPEYVDQARTGQNTVIVPYLSPAEVRAASLVNRGVKRRGVKADAATSTDIILTFGKAAQGLFEALPVETQDAAYKAVAERLTREMGLPLTGLAAHRDETAPHAHGQTLAYLPDGRPVSKGIRAADRARLQTLAAEEMARFVPGIVRGKPKADRIRDGEPRHKVQNMRVKELHETLPAQIEDKRQTLDQLTAREAEMRKRVADLEAKNALTAAEARRLEVYRARLEDRTRALVAATKERVEAAVAKQIEAKVEARVEALAGAALRSREAAVAAKEDRVRKVADNLTSITWRIRQVVGVIARFLSVNQSGRLNADLAAIEQSLKAQGIGPDPRLRQRGRDGQR